MSDPTKERLLRAAAELFATHGYRGCSVRMICAKADANPAAVNYHFGNKAKLWEAVLRDCSESLQGIIASTDLDQPFAAVLAEFIDKLFARFRSDLTFVRIMLWSALQADSFDYQTYSSVFRQFSDFAVHYFESLKQRGVIASDVDVPMVLPLLYGQLIFALGDRTGHRYYFKADLDEPEYFERLKRNYLRSVTLMLSLQPHPR